MSRTRAQQRARNAAALAFLDTWYATPDDRPAGYWEPLIHESETPPEAHPTGGEHPSGRERQVRHSFRDVPRGTRFSYYGYAHRKLAESAAEALAGPVQGMIVYLHPLAEVYTDRSPRDEAPADEEMRGAPPL